MLKLSNLQSHSLTCNQHAVHSPQALNCHHTLNSFLRVFMLHWNLQIFISQCLHQTKFRIWTHFDLSNVTQPEVKKNLRKLAPAPSITIGQLRAQIANFRYIDSDKSRPWIYYIGGGLGSGLILLIVICRLLYWCCKKNQKPKTRSPTCVAYTAPENQNMMHTRMHAISTDKYSVLGQETVGIQDPVGAQSKVMNNDMQYAFATALLDQLDDYRADVNEHHRRPGLGSILQNPRLRLKPP